MLFEEGWCTGAANCNYATGFSSPQGVTMDPSSGVLYVANTGTNTVCRVPPGGGACAWESG